MSPDPIEWAVRFALEEFENALAGDPPAGTTALQVKRFFNRTKESMQENLVSLVREQLASAEQASRTSSDEADDTDEDLERAQDGVAGGAGTIEWLLVEHYGLTSEEAQDEAGWMAGESAESLAQEFRKLRRVKDTRARIESTLNSLLAEEQGQIEIAVKRPDNRVKNFTIRFDYDGTHLIHGTVDEVLTEDGTADMNDVLRGIERIDPRAVMAQIIGITDGVETVVLPGIALKGLKGWEAVFG